MAEIVSRHVRYGGVEDDGVHRQSVQIAQRFSSTGRQNYVISFGSQVLTGRLADAVGAGDEQDSRHGQDKRTRYYNIIVKRQRNYAASDPGENRLER
jgi:hypothetical protein